MAAGTLLSNHPERKCIYDDADALHLHVGSIVPDASHPNAIAVLVDKMAEERFRTHMART